MKRFLRRLSVWVCLPLVLAFADIPAMAEAPLRVDCGTIVAIEIYRASDNQPINVGAVLGGIAGGVIGHQIGSGRGNTAATIGGAVAGNEIEKKQVQGSWYRITVRLDSGSSLIVDDTRDVNLRVGDRVRLENNRLHRI